MPDDLNPILDRLCEAFPACFDRSAPKPLKIGLGSTLMAQAGVHPLLAEVTRTQIRQALKAYTRAPLYQQALAAGGPRYDLDGQPAGEVTPEQQAAASATRPRPPSATEPATAGGYVKLKLVRRITPGSGG